MDKNRNITCDACHCIYNDGHMNCTADGIKVGTHSACSCDDTRCATFKLNTRDVEQFKFKLTKENSIKSMAALWAM